MILILGGTTEGRAAVRVADEAGQPYYYSTKGSAQTVECHHGMRLAGALDEEAMAHLCSEKGIRLLIDAAHPFALALHRTIAAVARRLDLPVIRYERRYPPRDPALVWCDDYADAMRRMEQAGVQRLLALSGVNTLAPLRPFWESHTCWFRILDRPESLAIAERQGFPPERLLFYREEEDPEREVEEEAALYKRIAPDAILTKESGYSGHFPEKAAAARQLGIALFVVKRPPLPQTFYVVYGEEGLRKRIERLLPEFYPLHSGFTTGACATAAAKAALLALLEGQSRREVEITLPSGEPISLPIEETRLAKGSATAVVVKEAGDDPDVTNHCRIEATVAREQDTLPEQVTFRGGEGVGTVTLPGLGLAVGEPAINATPRRMIREALIPLLPERSGVQVTIAIPGGEELAKRTFNPRLGIVGGLSVIGTSGIVRPFSNDAFIASIRKEASVAKAIGCQTLVLNSGAKSENYLRAIHPALPPQSFVHYGNFIGESLKIANELKFPAIDLGIMIGKAVKLAEGHLDTHSKKVVMDKPFLQELAREAGCDKSSVERIAHITLARELWTLFPPDEGRRFFRRLLQACEEHCAPLLSGAKLTISLITEEGDVFR